MRAPDRIVSQALAFGPHIGQFAERLLDAPFPSSKLRQGQRLLRLYEPGTPERWSRAEVLIRQIAVVEHAFIARRQ